MTLRAPFIYFGGKSRAASIIWDALGDVANYIEPFCGSAAVLLCRPSNHKINVETINDADGMISNFWRSIKKDPGAVELHASDPVIELDLHARHRWLFEHRESITEKLREDPEWCDPKVAGWWVWGINAWIGPDWCVSAQAAKSKRIPFFGTGGLGIHAKTATPWMALANRLADVDVACGDWKRVLTPTVIERVTRTSRHPVGVFLDPPYSTGNQQYAAGGTGTGLSAEVRKWCEANESDPSLRIVLAGYDKEHAALEARGWRTEAWNAVGSGYVGKGKERENQKKEKLWFSPSCLSTTKLKGTSWSGGSKPWLMEFKKK